MMDDLDWMALIAAVALTGLSIAGFLVSVSQAGISISIFCAICAVMFWAIFIVGRLIR